MQTHRVVPAFVVGPHENIDVYWTTVCVSKTRLAIGEIDGNVANKFAVGNVW